MPFGGDHTLAGHTTYLLPVQVATNSSNNNPDKQQFIICYPVLHILLDSNQFFDDDVLPGYTLHSKHRK